METAFGKTEQGKIAFDHLVFLLTRSLNPMRFYLCNYGIRTSIGGYLKQQFSNLMNGVHQKSHFL